MLSNRSVKRNGKKGRLMCVKVLSFGKYVCCVFTSIIVSL